MTTAEEKVRKRSALNRALQLLIEALDLIDAYEGPPEAAAHIEMARQRLQHNLAAR
jgi:hypothetical protein